MVELNDDPVDFLWNGHAPSIPQSFSFISRETRRSSSDPLPMVIIRDSSPTNYADLSIFPPSNHENLTPSCTLSDHQQPPQQFFSASTCDWSALLIENLDPEKAPPLLASPISTLLYPRSNSGPLSSEEFNSGSFPQSPVSYPSSEVDLPASQLPVSAAPRWWGVAFQIIRTKFCDFGSLFGNSGSSSVWPIRNFGLTVAAASVMWLLWLRERRRRILKRRNSVRLLLQIMREKDEKIAQLLNQIAQLNELLIGCQKS